MEVSSDPMHTLLPAEFTALLARASLSHAAFARLAGITARQVNNRARGCAVVPAWASLLVVVLQDHSPEALTIILEESAAAVLMTEAKAGASGQSKTSPPPSWPTNAITETQRDQLKRRRQIDKGTLSDIGRRGDGDDKPVAALVLATAGNPALPPWRAAHVLAARHRQSVITARSRQVRARPRR
jgi:hypothetical protein